MGLPWSNIWALALPLLLLPLPAVVAFVHARSEGGELPESQMFLWGGLLTWVAVHLLGVAVAFALKAPPLKLWGVPAAIATLLLVVPGALSLQRGSGFLDIRPIHLVLFPATLLIDLAQQAGLRGAESSKDLTFAQARERKFRTEAVALFADGPGLLLTGRVGLRVPSSPSEVRLTGVDESGHWHPVSGERLTLPLLQPSLMVRTGGARWLFDAAEGTTRVPLVVDAAGLREGPALLGVTAATADERGVVWVACEKDRYRERVEPDVRSEVMRLVDGQWQRAFALQGAESGPDMKVLAMRFEGAQLHLVVAEPSHGTSTPERLLRYVYRDGKLTGPVVVQMQGSHSTQVVVVGADQRAVVLRRYSDEPVLRFLPDGTRDESFQPQLASVDVAHLAVSDVGAVWLLVQGSPAGSQRLVRLRADGSVDPSWKGPL